MITILHGIKLPETALRLRFMGLPKLIEMALRLGFSGIEIQTLLSLQVVKNLRLRLLKDSYLGIRGGGEIDAVGMLLRCR